MRIVTINSKGSLQDTFLKARQTCNPLFTRAFNDSLDAAKDAAVLTAPVYNPLLYHGFEWSRYHKGPHGRLKKSVGRWPIGCHMNGRLFTGDLNAKTAYANWVEHGIREHNLSGRPIKGQFFMKKAMTVFEKKLTGNLDAALVEIFGGK